MLMRTLAAALILGSVPGSVAAQSKDKAATPAPAPTPVGNPADWFPADAYPAAAKAAGQEGRTVFAVSIDKAGRVTGCNITESSGSPLLDSTTCSLVVTRGRFKPAVDGSGQPVAGTWRSAMRWTLQAGAPSDEAALPL